MSDFKTVLAIDTAMSGCGAAVYCAARAVAASRVEPMVRGQAEALVPLIEAVMAEAGLAYTDLEAIVTTRGPGAFTGLRIGMSTAKSMALALAIPAYGVTTLQALALEYVEKEQPKARFSVLIETKRDDFYFQSYDEVGKPVSEAIAAPGEEIAQQAEMLCIGDAAERFIDEAGLEGAQTVRGFSLPDPLIVAKTFIDTGAAGAVFTMPPAPLYLRGADVSFSKKPQRTIAGQ